MKMTTVIRLEIDIEHTSRVSAEELASACRCLDFVKWINGHQSVTSGSEVLGNIIQINSEPCGQFL